MNNPISISTGCIHKFSDDRNILIEELKNMPVQGIELSFAHPNYLLDFNINKDNLEYLQGLRYNSIHAPWIDIKYGNNDVSKKVLVAIENIFKLIKAQCVVFHEEQIEDYKFIMNSNFLPAIENDDWLKPKHNTEDIRNILNSNQKFKFILDFAHAMTVSHADVITYFNEFKDKLAEVHLSVINKESGKHDFLYKNKDKEINDLVSNLENGFMPVVLEGIASSLNDIKEEIEYIRLV
jgi:hypothetical protein